MAGSVFTRLAIYTGNNGVFMKRYSMLIVSSLAVLIAGPSSADTLEFVCDFPRQATDEGIASQDFGMTFVVDTVSGDAFIKGNNGVAPVAALRGDYAVTFLETLDSGAVQTTTVALTGEAVHSRHTILGSSVMSPSQNYGTCDW